MQANSKLFTTASIAFHDFFSLKKIVKIQKKYGSYFCFIDFVYLRYRTERPILKTVGDTNNTVLSSWTSVLP